MLDLGSGLSHLRIRDAADIRPSAEYFSERAKTWGRLRISATDNLATRVPMTDEHGEHLATSVFGWVGDWWEDPAHALRNPLAEACRLASGPFWANKNGAWNEFGDKVHDDLDFSWFETVFEPKACMVFPVHLPYSRIGMVAFVCLENERDDFSSEMERMFDRLYLMSHIFIEDYVKLNLASKWIPGSARLSKAEISCLRWIGRGKTDIEVGLILGKARPTIRFHVQNAMTKLGAVNRAQAVLRAAQLGYLSSSP